ncbi:MAG: nicotinate phosphoribosyltransferase [Patescibacteria group bacterium]
MPKVKHHFFIPDYMNIFDLDQIYMTSSMWHDTGMKGTWATFDLLVKDMPKNRNFLIFTGLEEMALFLQNWKFTNEQIKILKNAKLISNNFVKYLKKLKFSGHVWAMPEGSVFFNNEPVLRITAPLIEANLLTAFFITSLSSNTIFSSKFIRSVIAAKNKSVIGPSPNRAHSFESAFKAQRSALIVGSNNIPSPIVKHLFNVPLGDNATIAYHAFINSYASESKAMEIASKHAQVDLSLMIDTYDYKSGIRNALIIAKEYAKQGRIIKLVIDSGDLYKNAVMLKKEIDKAKLKNVRITVASNLDEFKIKRLIDQKIPADTFIVNTEAMTSSDDPKLEAVYKISEIIKPSGAVVNKMKLSPGKMSLPGRKQIYRKLVNQKWIEDIIGLEDEKNIGNPLLKPIFKRGKLVYVLPNLFNIREYVKKQLRHLPNKYLAINKIYKYPVKTSKTLKKLINKTKKEIIY